MNEYNQESDPETDYEDEDDIEEEVDDIWEDEEFTLLSRRNGSYYIGQYYYDKPFNVLLLSSSVNPRVFFKYSYSAIVKYLYEQSILPNTRNPKIEILKLYISQEIYTSVIKTHWLRLVQRRWKNIFKRRVEIIQMRRSINSLRFRETHGKFPATCKVLPGLRGMLSNIIGVT